jgi:hypothetical protein
LQVVYRHPVRLYNASRFTLETLLNTSFSKHNVLKAGNLALNYSGVLNLSSKLVYDLHSHWEVIAGSMIGVTFISIAWVSLLSFFVKTVIWSSILCLIVFFAASSAFCYERFQELRHSGLSEILLLISYVDFFPTLHVFL